MKVIIALVVQYAAKDWADEYGIAETEALNDFAEALRRTVHDGGIPETLDKHWPMMRGHITAHMVDGLDATTRDELLHLLQEAPRRRPGRSTPHRDHRTPRRAPAGSRRPRSALGRLPHVGVGQRPLPDRQPGNRLLRRRRQRAVRIRR